MNPGDPVVVDWAWVPQVSVWGLVLAGVTAAVFLILSWRGSRGGPRNQRLFLLGLRAVALLGLGLVVAGPQQVLTRERGLREQIAVVIDASRSMRVEDAAAGSRSETVARWLQDRAPEFKELASDFDLRFFLFGDELRPWDAASEGVPSDDPGTDLGAGLYGLRAALGGRRPAGVLLVSDGADRSALGRAFERGGREAVGPLLKELSVPVSTWVVGAREGLSDLSLSAVHAPPFGFVRRPLTVSVDLLRSGLPAAPVTVTLEGEGELLASQEVDLSEAGEGQVEFALRPDRIGYHSYRLATAVPVGDVIPSNNQIEFTVKVVRDRTRVLQVSSRPSWDVKFLRRLLKTDPNIDLVSFFILRTSDYAGDLARREPLSLIAFPYEDLFSQDLQGFDLVIFQNFWFGSFASFSDTRFLTNIARFVEEGGALMMVGGDITGEADYGNSPLAEVLPSVLPRATQSTLGRQAVLTKAGHRHPVTRLARDSEQNAERWAALPLLRGWNEGGPLVGDSVALLDAGQGTEPLLSVRSVGRGRSLLFGSDSSWRWALAHVEGGGAGRDHAIFWRNAIRWLVKDAEQRQVQVVTDAENYRLGTDTAVQVRVLGSDYAPQPDESVRLSVRRVGSEQLFYDEEAVTDSDGEITLTLSLDEVGTYSIEAVVASIAEPFGRSEARVTVVDRDGESADPSARPELMAALADVTGGKALPSVSPDPSAMVLRRTSTLVSSDRQWSPLWDSGWLLLLIGLALGAEWSHRRRLGLP
jgi:uncharacterized membrane protein